MIAISASLQIAFRKKGTQFSVNVNYAAWSFQLNTEGVEEDIDEEMLRQAIEDV